MNVLNNLFNMSAGLSVNKNFANRMTCVFAAQRDIQELIRNPEILNKAGQIKSPLIRDENDLIALLGISLVHGYMMRKINWSIIRAGFVTESTFTPKKGAKKKDIIRPHFEGKTIDDETVKQLYTFWTTTGAFWPKAVRDPDYVDQDGNVCKSAPHNPLRDVLVAELDEAVANYNPTESDSGWTDEPNVWRKSKHGFLTQKFKPIPGTPGYVKLTVNEGEFGETGLKALNMLQAVEHSIVEGGTAVLSKYCRTRGEPNEGDYDLALDVKLAIQSKNAHYQKMKADQRFRLYTVGRRGYQNRKSVRDMLTTHGEELTEDGKRAVLITIADKLKFRGTDDERVAFATKAVDSGELDGDPRFYALVSKSDTCLVAMDNCCSGLQMLAAMTGDLELAKATNLTGTTVNKDAYTIFAELAGHEGRKWGSAVGSRLLFGAGEDTIVQGLHDAGFRTQKIELLETLAKINQKFPSIMGIAAHIRKPFTAFKPRKFDADSIALREEGCNKWIEVTFPGGNHMRYTIDRYKIVRINDNFSITFEDSKTFDLESMITSILANLIHFLDAHMLAEVVTRADFEVSATVHDTFMCHPNNYFKLRSLLKEVMKDMARQDLLNVMLEQIKVDIDGERVIGRFTDSAIDPELITNDYLAM